MAELAGAAASAAVGLVEHALDVTKKLSCVFAKNNYETFVFKTKRVLDDCEIMQAAFAAADEGQASEEQLQRMAVMLSSGDKEPMPMPGNVRFQLANPKQVARDPHCALDSLYDNLLKTLTNDQRTGLYDSEARFTAYCQALVSSGIIPIAKEVMLSTLRMCMEAGNSFLVHGSHTALQISCIAHAMSHRVFADVPPGSTIFFLVGESQVGKSTLINALVGKATYRIEKNEETEEDELVLTSGSEVAARGSGFSSCTFMINVYCDDAGRYFADCPGMNDSRGYDIEAGMVSGVYLALRRAGVTVKVLRVWDAEKLKMPGPTTTRQIELAQRAATGNTRGGNYIHHVVAKRGLTTLHAAAQNIVPLSSSQPATELSLKLLRECAEKGLAAFTLDMLNGLKKAYDTEGYPDTTIFSMETIDNLVLQMTQPAMVSTVATPVVKLINSEMRVFVETTGMGESEIRADAPVRFEQALKRLEVIVKALNTMVRKTRTMCSREDGSLRAMEDLGCYALQIPLMATQKIAQIVIAAYFARFVAPMLNMLAALRTGEDELRALEAKLKDLNLTLFTHMSETDFFRDDMASVKHDADDGPDRMYRVGVQSLSGCDWMDNKVRALQEFKEMADKIDTTLCDYSTFATERRYRTEGSGKRRCTVTENVTVTQHHSREQERQLAKDRVQDTCRKVSLHLSSLVMEIMASLINVNERYQSARNLLS